MSTDEPILLDQVVVHSAYEKEGKHQFLRVDELYTVMIGEGSFAVMSMDRKTQEPKNIRYFPMHAVDNIDGVINAEYAKGVAQKK